MAPKQIAVLDACVLYPAGLRSVLMYLALSGLFRAHWTDAIHDEWVRNVLEDRKDIPRAQLDRTRRLMNDAIPGSLVTGYEGLIEKLEMPDQNDRHVLAAAIHIQARTIVTFNERDFPEAALSPYQIHACAPDAFVLQLLQTEPNTVTEALRTDRISKRRPPKSPEEYLEALKAQKLLRTSMALESYLKDLS